MQPVSRKLANKQTHETKNNASPVRSVHLCPHESNYNAIFHDPFMLRPVYSDTTQLNWTQLNSTQQREQQLTQFVGRDVIKKTRLTWLYAVQLGQLSSVELCRYKHPFRPPATRIRPFQTELLIVNAVQYNALSSTSGTLTEQTVDSCFHNRKNVEPYAASLVAADKYASLVMVDQEARRGGRRAGAVPSTAYRRTINRIIGDHTCADRHYMHSLHSNEATSRCWKTDYWSTAPTVLISKYRLTPALISTWQKLRWNNHNK